MKVRVTKKTKNENTYRTPLNELDGMPHEPIVGHGLLLTSSTHESGGIFTSDVKDFEKYDWGYVINTQTSTYKIEVM